VDGRVGGPAPAGQVADVVDRDPGVTKPIDHPGGSQRGGRVLLPGREGSMLVGTPSTRRLVTIQ